MKLQAILANRGSELARIVERAGELDGLLASVRAALPEAARERVFGVNLRSHTLVVITDSAAWASRVRYSSEALRARLAAEYGVEIRKVWIRYRECTLGIRRHIFVSHREPRRMRRAIMK